MNQTNIGTVSKDVNLGSSAKCVCACVCVCVCVLFLDQLACSFPVHGKFDLWLPFGITELTHDISLQVCYRHHRKKTESSAVPGHWPVK